MPRSEAMRRSSVPVVLRPLDGWFRHWSFVIRYLAALLPLFAFGHSTEFLDAKLYFDAAGIAHVEITADYAGNPMLSTKEEAESALRSALALSFRDQQRPLTDFAPLIVKHGAIRGWVLYELIQSDPEALQQGYEEILQAFEEGAYRQRVASVYFLDEVRRAHEEMAKGAHIGKMVLIP